MNCPACGADNREGAHFCRMCGKVLLKPPVPEEPPKVEVVEVHPGEPAPEGEAAGIPRGVPVAVPPDEPSLEAGFSEAVPKGPELKGKDEKAPPEGTSPQGEPAQAPLDESPSEADTLDMPSADDAPEVETLIPRLPWKAADQRSRTSGSDAAAAEVQLVEPVPAATTEDPMSETLESDAPLDASAAEGAAADAGSSARSFHDTLTADPAVASEALLKEPIPEADMREAPIEATAEAVMDDLISEPESDAAAPEREASKPLSAAAPGTVIAGRFVVVEALDVHDSEILYRARDLVRCWQCSFEGNAADDTFCAQCGASLDRRPEVRLLEVQGPAAEAAAAEPSSGEAVAARLTDEDRFFLLLTEPEPELQAPPTAQSIRLLVGQRSDAGQVRELDEDSLLVLTVAPTYESRTGPVLGLFAVADGMGGHEGGEVASKVALQVLAGEALRTIIVPELAGEFAAGETIIARLRQATIAANDAVYLDRKKRENDMGTTLTTALIRDDQLFLAHVGDCRAYRWNADGLVQLTADHSLIASMIASGQATPEEIYSHPHRSVIYRCIGDRPVVEVDTHVLPLAPDDRIIVCCDGLWEMVRNEGIEDVMMQEADPQAACELLVSHANVAGGEDNISVIVVQVDVM